MAHARDQQPKYCESHTVNNNLTAKEKAYVGLVKELPCSVCDAEGPSDAHHIKQHNQYTVVALCKSCHQGSKMGWHGEKRAWAIAKMEPIDALNVTIRRVMELLMSR